MALTERLALLVSLDARGAITGLERVGAAADRNLGKAEKGLVRTGHAMQRFGVSAVAVGGLAAVGLWKAGQAASDLYEVVTKTGVVFGKSTKQVEDFAASASKIGHSRQSALQAASGFGNLFTTMGLSQQAAADMSIELTKLASDLASFQNTDPGEAAEALMSGLIGEVKPMRQYGVLLNEATLKQEAFNLKLTDSTTGVLPPAIRAQAAYSVILKQTINAQGDYNRTADGAANLQRTLAAEAGNLASSIGNGALPAMQTMLGATNDLIGGLNRLNAVSDGTVGTMATWGSVGLIAAGGLSFLVGKAIVLREAITLLPSRIGTLTTGIGTLGRVALGVGGNLGILSVAGQLLGFQAGHENVDKLTRSLQGLANSGAVTGVVAEAFGDDFDALGDAVNRVAAPGVLARVDDFGSSWKRAIGWTDDPLSRARNKINDLDDALAQLAATDPSAAAAALDAIVKALPPSEGKRLVGLLEDYRVATEDATAASKDLGPAADDAAGGLDGLGGSAGDAGDALSVFADAVDGALDPLDTLAAFDKVFDGENKIARHFARAAEGVEDARDRLRDARKSLQEILDEPLDDTKQKKIAGKKRYIEFLLRKPPKDQTDEWFRELESAKQDIVELEKEIEDDTRNRAKRVQDARDDIVDAERDVQKALAETNRSLEGNSEAAVNNRDMLIGSARDITAALKQAAADDNVSYDEFVSMRDRGIAALQREADQFRGNKTVIDDYINRIRTIDPPKIKVGVEVEPSGHAFLDRLLAAGGDTSVVFLAPPGGGLNFPPIPYRAHGGPVSGGHPYIVGERGPELMVPARSGTVVPNNALGTATNHYNVTIINPTPEPASVSVPRELRSLAWQLGAA